MLWLSDYSSSILSGLEGTEEEEQRLDNLTNSIICLSMLVISYLLIEAGLPPNSGPSIMRTAAMVATCPTAAPSVLPIIEAYLVRSAM
jgi:hypothetical protein